MTRIVLDIRHLLERLDAAIARAGSDPRLLHAFQELRAEIVAIIKEAAEQRETEK